MDEERPARDETKAFVYCPQPVLHKIIAYHVPLAHQLLILFSILTRQACAGAFSISLDHNNIGSLFHYLKKFLFEPKI